jgi:hypothetical protein
LSRELRPRILEDLGLRAALEFLADGVAKRTESVVTTKVDVEERLPPLVETTVYRLIQEALTNASRHAKATHIDVTLARDGWPSGAPSGTMAWGSASMRPSGARATTPWGFPGSGIGWRPLGGRCKSTLGPSKGPF